MYIHLHFSMTFHLKSFLVYHKIFILSYIIFCLRLFSNISQNPAIHIQNVSVYKIRRKEYCRSFQILRRSPTCSRCFCNDKLIKGMTLSIRLNLTKWRSLRCCNITGANTITLDIIFTIFRRNISGQHLQTTLCCSMRRYGPLQSSEEITALDTILCFPTPINLFKAGYSLCIINVST